MPKDPWDWAPKPKLEGNLWGEIASILKDSTSASPVEVLRADARNALTDENVNKIIIHWSRTALMEAKTERELIIHQCLVASLLQLRNLFLSKINNGKVEAQDGTGRLVEPTANGRYRGTATNYFGDPPGVDPAGF